MARAVVMRTSGGLVQRNPTENRIRALIGALTPNQHVILEQFGESSKYYIQVRLKDDGFFQLEYRAGCPAEHYQALTKSQEKVALALFGWSRGEAGWRNDLEWLPIGHLFEQQ